MTLNKSTGLWKRMLREPLCKFLDLPVPDEPFPHGNPPKAFLDRIEKKKSDCTVDIVKWSLWGLGGLATSFAALRYLKR